MGVPQNFPVIGAYPSSAPFNPLSSQALTGSGPGGLIVAGQTSNAITLRIYNNFQQAVSIKDALNCVFAVYDDTTTPGSASGAPASQTWTQLMVLDYGGNAALADTTFAAIGGQVKHAMPVNGGTLAGSGSDTGTANSYCTIQVRWAPPATASSTSASCGLWLEYSYS